jgi:hypothetical protein
MSDNRIHPLFPTPPYPLILGENRILQEFNLVLTEVSTEFFVKLD